MRSKAPFLILAAVVLAAAGFFVLGGGPSTPPGQELGRAEAQEAPEQPAAPVDLVGVGDGDGDGDRAAVDDALVGDGALDDGSHPWAGKLAGVTGRIVEEDGTPVVAMRVELLEVDLSSIMKVEHSAMGLESPEVGEAFTDEEGRFLLDDARQTAYHALNIGRGTGRATVRFIEHALEHGELTDVGDIVLPAFGTLVGTVIDEDGEPVAGARIRALPIPEVVVQSGVLDLREGTVVAGGEDDDRKLAFDIPRRAFQVLERLPVPTTYSAADGTFRLEGVTPGAVSGGADFPKHVAAPFGPIDLAAGEEKDVGELELLFGREVTGKVTDGAGRPVAGVEVSAGALNPLVPVGLMQPAGVTDEAGRYSVEGIPEDGRLLGIARRTSSETWTVAEAAGVGDVVDIVLPTATPVLVKLRDEEGEPIEGGDVRFTETGGESEMVQAMLVMNMFEGFDPEPAKSREVEPGDYEVGNVTYGDWSVEARAPGYAPAFGEVTHAGDGTSLTLTMTRGNVIRVTVTDEATGELLPKAHAMLMGPKGGFMGSYAGGFTDEEGVAELGPVSSTFLQDVKSGRSFFGGVSVVVEHPEHGTSYEDVADDLAFVDGSIDVAVALPARCTLTGRVSWAGEDPPGLYMIALRHIEEEMKLQMTSPPRTALTNQEGRFRFTGVAPGKYRATIMERWLQGDPISLIIDQKEPKVLDDRSVDVEVAKDNFLDVQLSPEGEGPTGSFAGRVTSNGAGVPGLKVEVRGLEEALVLETNSVGEFETPQISTMKRVGIRISGPIPMDDGELVEQKVYDEWNRPKAEQTTRIDLDLNYQRVRIAVVDKETGAPLPGAEVKMRGKGRRSWRGGTEKTTDAKGMASFVVPDGDERTIQVTKKGYGTLRLEVSERDAGETLTAELQPAVPCRGTVVPPEGANRDRLFFRVDTGGGRGEGWTQVDSDELTFNVEGLMPGTYRAETWTGTQGMIQVEFDLGPNGDENLVLDFTRPIK